MSQIADFHVSDKSERCKRKLEKSQIRPTLSGTQPVFEVLGLHLGHLTTGEVEDLLTEEFQDDHVVMTQALAGPTRTNNITDEGGPVFGPLLLQDLRQQKTGKPVICVVIYHQPMFVSILTTTPPTWTRIMLSFEMYTPSFCKTNTRTNH